ncbi:Coenzyme F420 hydrogenase/dehydrogenase, beta subunit C-terminal domain [Hwanghaeella sp.]|uniref:Coenzyme F420 hydrogenase/dehydrogenase, beta subunit C-terminal domain n=1 Tax=Hwanghaeella sp. TaxID=2605943 RepID=UPI003CCBC81A
MTDLITLAEIVESGLCIGCGLCQSIAGEDAVEIVMTPEGRLRPLEKAPVDPASLALINKVCPGLVVTGPDPDELAEGHAFDEMWGPLRQTVLGHAGDPVIRFQAAAGGGLTGLASFLLESGRVERVLHVTADPDQPMRSRATISTTPEQVLRASGSRYGPTAPLVEFLSLLEDGKPFAFVGKPCDVDAIRALEMEDPRVASLCRYKLSLVCGGASELGKSQDLLAGLGVEEPEVTLFRYRGYGNPGKTRIEVRDGRAWEFSYQEMWEDEGTWRLQFRCKICPDPIGELTDIAVLDCWPGGGPTGEDAGFNAFITRTAAGDELFQAAVAAGAIVVDGPVSARMLDDYQPHQVRKKRALAWRLQGMREAGVLTPAFERLRLDTFAYGADDPRAAGNLDGIKQRIASGRTRENPVRREGD